MASQVVLITASSAGLGATTAKAFAQNGFRVAINYHSNKAKADGLRDEIEKTTPCVAIYADMTNRQDIKQLVCDVVKRFGRLDVVVSNQGWTRMRNFSNLEDNVDEDDWDTCFDVNVKSHLWLFHAASPHLRLTEGAFISVASLAGVVPSGSSLVSLTHAVQEGKHLPSYTMSFSRMLSPNRPRSISSRLWPKSLDRPYESIQYHLGYS
jgi:NAD(P)-dependent dehydrogenase (short-subunit alcohol dehydrogenase family)